MFVCGCLLVLRSPHRSLEGDDMEPLQQTIAVTFRYPVHFTTGVFDPDNPLLHEVITAGDLAPARLLVVVDRGVHRGRPGVIAAVERYCDQHAEFLDLACPPLVIEGGEATKNSRDYVGAIHEVISDAGLCHRSYVVIVGGGAVMDMAGYAAATAHRGLRVVRVPTTTLGQADAGLALENNLNGSGRKDFVGAFAPPFAVVNDAAFLSSLGDRDWRGGLAEAVKVALMADGDFFRVLERQAVELVTRDAAAMTRAVRRSAALHLRHVAGPPDGVGASRPLEFGHWAAHRLEALTDFSLRHGEAVAIGMALDVTYSHLAGLLAEDEWLRILALMASLGFELWVPELGSHVEDPDHPRSLVRGLDEFRERGGPATVPLLRGIGQGTDADALALGLLARSIETLRRWSARRARVAAAVA
jgi:3-dehydroquinate synthase